MATDSIKITDTDLNLTRLTLESMLTGSVTHVTSAEVFEEVKTKLSIPMNKNAFCPALSKSISTGRLAGFYSRRGPGGGIFKGEMKTKTPINKQTVIIETKPLDIESQLNKIQVDETIKEVEPKPYLTHKREEPKVKELVKNELYEPSKKFEMIVNGELFQVPANILYIKLLLNKVFDAKVDENGNVKLENETYMVSDHITLAKTLLWFINASIVRKSNNQSL